MNNRGKKVTGINQIKDFLWKYYTVKTIVSKMYNFLVVITPVFDPAYDSVCTLIADLQSQSFGRFTHILISNGSSPKIKKYIAGLHKKDPRFIYVELPEETVNTPEEIFFNVCRRRNYGMKNYKGERYVFLDADVKIIDTDYFLKLYKAHREIRRDILLTLVKMNVDDGLLILPVFPILLGRIDLSNLSISKRIAGEFSYPADHDPAMGGYGNDYRFFNRISNENNTAVLNFFSAIGNGNRSYKRLIELLCESNIHSKY